MGCGVSKIEISDADQCRCKDDTNDGVKLVETEAKYFEEFFISDKNDIIAVVGMTTYNKLEEEIKQLQTEEFDEKKSHIQQMRPEIERIQQLMMDNEAFTSNSNALM